MQNFLILYACLIKVLSFVYFFFQQGTKYLAEPWYFDINGTMELQEYNFTRSPIIVQAEVN